MSSTYRKFLQRLNTAPLTQVGEHYKLSVDIPSKLKKHLALTAAHSSWRVIDNWRWVPIKDSIHVSRLGTMVWVTVLYRPVGLGDL